MSAAATVDTDFANSVGQFYEPDEFGSVASLLVLPDGSLLVGSNEMAQAGATPPLQVSLMQFNRDGSVASTFFSDTDPNGSGLGIFYDSTGWPEVMAIGRQSDGRLVVGGVMQGMRDGTTSWSASNLLRINPDSTVDATFGNLGTFPWPTGGVNYVEDLIIEPNDKILINGGFGGIRQLDTSVVTRHGLARLNADGTVDSTFNLIPTEHGVPAGAGLVRAIFYSAVRDVAGNYYVAGIFEWSGGVNCSAGKAFSRWATRSGIRAWFVWGGPLDIRLRRTQRHSRSFGTSSIPTVGFDTFVARWQRRPHL
ncbi:MAG: delta-60 repeat domain-containing protein [Verrucomicrobia bacterium]|nr:delta-60 repeat domain-containing protein [Verrucomicrobiota bacterium]